MMEEPKVSYWFKFRRFIIECKRVLKVTRKPSMFEFKTIVKVTGLGMIIMGATGFVIQFISTVFF